MNRFRSIGQKSCAAAGLANDENMLIIGGNARLADTYFTEFNRLFNHYYFCSVCEETHTHESKAQQEDSLFLEETPQWLDKSEPDKIRAKRVKMFVDMEGVVPEPA